MYFQFSKKLCTPYVPNVLKNIGLMSLVWRLENTYKNEIIKVNKFVIQKFGFICFTYDEVTTMDNTSLASVHSYIMQD
jgi:hypothetical protein